MVGYIKHPDLPCRSVAALFINREEGSHSTAALPQQQTKKITTVHTTKVHAHTCLQCTPIHNICMSKQATSSTSGTTVAQSTSLHTTNPATQPAAGWLIITLVTRVVMCTLQHDNLTTCPLAPAACAAANIDTVLPVDIK